MYTKFWGLKEKPFENTPDPRFFYQSPKHEEALARMLYVIESGKALAILTGDYGSGKTLICRTLLTHLNSESYRAVVIANPQIPLVEFLMEISRQLGADKIPDRKIEILNLIEALLKRNIEVGRKPVVIVDEAHLIEDPSTLEELRLLLNFQSSDRFLLTLLLVGQTELRERINNSPQLKQRASIVFHLPALNQKETAEYIGLRLKVAGDKKEVFTSDSVRAVYQHSKGFPRAINNICDLALLAGFGKERKKIDKKIIEGVVAEL